MGEEAGRVVYAIELQTQAAKAAGKDLATSVDQSASKIERAAFRAERSVVKSGARIANAQRNIGRQFADIGAQASSGQSFFVIMSQQLPQLADAVADTEGKFAGFARFLGNPWVAAGVAAASALIPIISNMLKTGDSVDALVAKMKEHAKQQDLNERAAAAYAHTLEGLAAAIKAQREEQEKAITTDVQAQLQALALARARAAENETKRSKLASELAAAEQRLKVVRARPGSTGEFGEAVGEYKDLLDKIAGLRAQLAIADKAAADASVAIAAAEAPIIQSEVESAFDARTAAVRRYTKALGDLNVALKIGAGKTGQVQLALPDGTFRETTVKGISRAEYERRLRAITAQRDAAIKAAEEANRSSSAQTGRDIDLAEARRIVASVGGRVTSDHRSYAEQAALYARYKAGKGPLAAKPGTSLHEFDRAVDVAKTAGVTLEKLKKAFTSLGVTVSEALDEGDHFHIGFGPKGAGQGAAEKAKREAAQLAERRADNEARFQDQLAAYDTALAEARKQQVHTAEEAVAAELAAIDAEHDRTQQKIELDTLDRQRSDEANSLRYGVESLILSAKNEELRGLRKQAVQEREQQRLDVARIQLAEGALRDQAETLGARADLATTLDERRAIELSLLDISRQIELKKIDELLASKQLNDAERQRLEESKAHINDVYALRQQGLERQYESPLDAYYRSINLSPAQLGDKAEQAVVDELRYVHDGITDAIAKEIGAKDPLIKELLSLFIDQVIMKPIADALRNAAAHGGGSGVGGFLTAITSFLGFGGGAGGAAASAGSIGSGSAGAGAGLLGFAQGGAMMVGGMAGTDRNIISINGRKAFRASHDEMLQVVPTNMRASVRGGGSRVYNINVSADHSVTPAGFARGLASQILAEAQRMDRQTASATLNAVPGAVAQAQRYGR